MEDENKEGGNAARMEGRESGERQQQRDRRTDRRSETSFVRAGFSFYVSVSAAGELESLLLYL